METKIKTSIENKNFLNNQNYIISNSSKWYIFSKFLFFKYLSIFSNRFIGTIIFILLFNLFLAVFHLFDYFYGYIFIILIFFLSFLPYIIFIIFLFIFYYKIKNKKSFVKINNLFPNNNKIKFNFLEFSNPIYSLKTFFILDESNTYYRVNLFSMIFRTLLYLFFILVIFIIFIHVTKLVYFNEILNSSFLNLILILVFLLFLYLFKSLYFNFLKFRFINIILFPIFLIIFLPIFIYNKFVKIKNYNIFLLKPFNFRFEWFSYIWLKEAYNEYYKVIFIWKTKKRKY